MGGNSQEMACIPGKNPVHSKKRKKLEVVKIWEPQAILETA